MKFNPITKEIYTDNEEFVKKLDCPYKINWNDLEEVDMNSRKCSNGEHLIVDTKFLPDEQLLNMVNKNPKTCLKINLNQENIKIITNGIVERK